MPDTKTTGKRIYIYKRYRRMKTNTTSFTTKNSLMKKVISIITILATIGLSSFAMQNKEDQPLRFEDYSSSWAEVEAFEKVGQTKSALEQVSLILEQAQKDENAVQQIKSYLYQFKYAMILEEESEARIVNDLNALTTAVEDDVVRSVVHSVLAESLWQYYQQNRYKFLNRSQTAAPVSDDFRTWDLVSLLKEIRKHHLAALEPAAALQATPVSSFDAILIQQKDSEIYRPAVYDLLVHRAIDFFMTGESGLTEGVEPFDFDREIFFSPSAEFASLVLDDRFAFKRDALAIFQGVVDFHLAGKNDVALMDAELKRLSYVYNNSTLDNKAELYQEALTNLYRRYPDDEFSTYVQFRLAQHFEQLGRQDENRPSAEDGSINYRKEALALCTDAIQRFPKSMGADHCRNLENRIKAESLSVQSERVVVPGLPFKALVNYTNVSKVHFRLVALSEDEYRNIREMHNDRQQWIKRMVNRDPLRAWTQDIPEVGDYYDHSTEVAMDALERGAYILLASYNESFKSNVSVVNEIWASDLAYLTRKSEDGNLEVYIADRTTGSPVSDATVTPYFLEYDYQTRKQVRVQLDPVVTNASGYALVKKTGDQRSRQISFSVGKGSDFLDVSPYHYLQRPHEYQERERQQTFFFTDRSIYRPGQTIYFKGITVLTDGKSSEILANAQVQVSFKDVNYEEVASLRLTSNEYGSFHGSFTAPTGGLNGQMTILDGHGQATVSVEEYKRPTFEVIMDTLSGSYGLDQTVELTGSARSYSGAVLPGVTVRYRIVREVRYPVWYWGWYYRHPQTSSSREIGYGEVQTDADGSFAIRFETIPDQSIPEKDDPRFRYTVSVDVIDAGGETRSAEKTVTAGYKGLELSLGLVERYSLTQDQRIAVRTENLDGRFEASEVRIELFRFTDKNNLKRDRLWEEPDQFVLDAEEHQRLFPDDVYRRLSAAERPKEQVAVYEVNTVEQKDWVLDAGVLELSGAYWVEATTKDRAGNEITYKSGFMAYDPGDNDPVEPVHLKILADQKSYAPGDMAELEVVSFVEEGHLFYKISHDGEVERSGVIPLNGSKVILEIPITEAHRGGMVVHAAMVYKNRDYKVDKTIAVPYESHELEVEWMTFRDLLKPGETEEWKLKLKGPKGELVAAELMASMYDKSLDYFKPHQLQFNPTLNPWVKQTTGFSSQGNFEALNAWLYQRVWDKSVEVHVPAYDGLNLFGFSLGYPQYLMRGAMMDEVKVMSKASMRDGAEPEAVFGYAAEESMEGEDDMDMLAAPSSVEEVANEDVATATDQQVPLRENLNETAFFFPQLTTNEEGEIIVNFTMPEALTTWRFTGIAHDKELQHKIFYKELKTQKELMVTPHFPRFFREGDRITVTSKLDNLSDEVLSGFARLVLKDALTGKEISGLILNTSSQDVEVPAGGSKVVEWDLQITDEVQAVTYEVYATAGKFTDGVTGSLPVLVNRMLVTESMPIWLKGAGSKTFTFDYLKNYQSTTLKHQSYTLEYASNPAWYAVQALPYLMEYPYECAEQLFSRYYANTLASHIANANPRIRDIFEQWKSVDSKALLSNLEKNQELKALLIEETPWLRDAANESDRKKRIALLFDMNRMASERKAILEKLVQMQTPNGGFSWFPGMRDNRYITQHILTGLAHLQQLNADDGAYDKLVRSIIDKAIPYLDARVKEDFDRIKKYDKDYKKNDHLSPIQIQYLYVRSHYKDYTFDDRTKPAFDYFLEQAGQFWLSKNYYNQAMISIALHGFFKREAAELIITSLDQNSIVDEEMGMYWKAIERGYGWYHAPIEAQAMLIEAFHTVADDGDAVNEMKVWLLKQKQVQDWKTTKATAEAVFALLLRGEDWLSNTEMVEVKVGEEVVDVRSMDGTYEAGTGYFKVNWDKSDIGSELAEVTVTGTTDAPSWGAVYWQYFEQLDKIEQFEETGLKINKSLFIQTNTDNGPVITSLDEAGDLNRGDLVKVRIELRVDRNMEFVHMKDMRGSGLEPVNVLSSYKYQDGLGYYESTRDAATNFFFDYLPKGVHVFEYDLRVSHKGDFSNGITTIQCMYAPEFTSHSEGVRVEVD